MIPIGCTTFSWTVDSLSKSGAHANMMDQLQNRAIIVILSVIQIHTCTSRKAHGFMKKEKPIVLTTFCYTIHSAV